MLDKLTIHTTEREGFLFSYVNEYEFEKIYTDIFKNKDYYFESAHSDPHILDCGSHIGISVLFFKSLYPDARIIAFEPHPENFALLQRNITQNNLRGVWAVNAAITDKNREITFYINQELDNWWTLSGSVIKEKVIAEYEPKPTVQMGLTLSSFLTIPVDLIKLDVQGIEQTILKEIQHSLYQISHLKMEYHGSSDQPENSLRKIVTILKEEGFSVQVTQEGRQISVENAIAEDLHWIIVHADK